MNLTTRRIAALANQHDADAAAVRPWGSQRAGRTLDGNEHAEIAEICRMYLSADQNRNQRREDIATAFAAAILTGTVQDPANLIDGPAIVYTAVDLAGLLLDELAKPRP